MFHSAVIFVNEDRWVITQTHGINGFSLLMRQYNCSCPVTCQCTCVNQKQPISCWTVVLFCDVHINIGSTLNLLQCLHVICGHIEQYILILIVRRHHCCCWLHVCRIKSAQAAPNGLSSVRRLSICRLAIRRLFLHFNYL